MFRVFGPAGTTFGYPVDVSNAAGRRIGAPSFWGLNDIPADAENWRHGSAVLDEWNRNGFLVVGTVLEGHSLPACIGLIAEQKGDKLGAQYLRGGSKQAMLQLPSDVGQQLNAIGARVAQTRVPETVELGGVRWEFRVTGWDDVNGVYGYLHMPGPGSVQTVRFGARTVATKREDE